MDTAMANAPAPNSGVNLSNLEFAFILGGPGAGKGTRCQKLARDLQLSHVSVGDLLRYQKNFQDLATKHKIQLEMSKGKLLYPDIIMPILRKEFEKLAALGETKILLDGFPLDFHQAWAFEREFGECSLLLYFNCSRKTMWDRVRGRAESSGRSDENDKTFVKRVDGYFNYTIPVIKDYQRKLGDRFIEVDAEVSLDDGYASLRETLVNRGFRGEFPALGTPQKIGP